MLGRGERPRRRDRSGLSPAHAAGPSRPGRLGRPGRSAQRRARPVARKSGSSGLPRAGRAGRAAGARRLEQALRGRVSVKSGEYAPGRWRPARSTSPSASSNAAKWRSGHRLDLRPWPPAGWRNSPTCTHQLCDSRAGSRACAGRWRRPSERVPRRRRAVRVRTTSMGSRHPRPVTLRRHDRRRDCGV